MVHDIRAVLLLGENASVTFSATMPDREPGNGKLILHTGNKELVKLLKKGMLCRLQFSNQAELTAKILNCRVNRPDGSLWLDCVLDGNGPAA